MPGGNNGTTPPHPTHQPRPQQQFVEPGYRVAMRGFQYDPELRDEPSERGPDIPATHRVSMETTGPSAAPRPRAPIDRRAAETWQSTAAIRFGTPGRCIQCRCPSPVMPWLQSP